MIKVKILNKVVCSVERVKDTKLNVNNNWDGNVITPVHDRVIGNINEL